MNRVILGPEYFPSPDIGRPISGAQIFVGDVDTDPEVVGNQKQLSVLQEDTTTVQVSQPVLTGAGGVPIHNGSPVTILVEGNYALKVLDSLGSQIYYVPSQDGSIIDSNDLSYRIPITVQDALDTTYAFDTVADMVAAAWLVVGQRVRTLGYLSIGDGGDNSYSIVAAGTGTDDGGLFVDLDTFQAQGLFPGGKVNVRQFGATGDGTTDDTVAVQTWLDLSGDLYLSEGTYLVDGLSTLVTGRTKITGAGPRKSEIRLASDAIATTVALTLSGGGGAVFAVALRDFGIRIMGTNTHTGLLIENFQENSVFEDLLISGAPSAGTVNDGVGVKIASTSPSPNLLALRSVSLQYWKTGIENSGGTNLTGDTISIVRGTQDTGTGTIGMNLEAGINIDLKTIHIEDYLLPVSVEATVANLSIGTMRAKWNDASTPTNMISISSGMFFYSLKNIENFNNQYTNTVNDLSRSVTLQGEFVVFAHASRKDTINSLVTDAQNVDSVWPGNLIINNGTIAVVPVSFSSSSGVLDLSSAKTDYSLTSLTENITSILFPSSPLNGQRLALRFKQAAGAYTVAGFPGDALLAGGAYTMTATSTKQDYIEFRFQTSIGWLEITRSQNM